MSAIESALAGWPQFQIVIEVSAIERTELGFHRAHQVERVVDVRRLRIDHGMWVRAHQYAQGRLNSHGWLDRC